MLIKYVLYHVCSQRNWEPNRYRNCRRQRGTLLRPRLFAGALRLLPAVLRPRHGGVRRRSSRRRPGNPLWEFGVQQPGRRGGVRRVKLGLRRSDSLPAGRTSFAATVLRPEAGGGRTQGAAMHCGGGSLPARAGRLRSVELLLARRRRNLRRRQAEQEQCGDGWECFDPETEDCFYACNTTCYRGKSACD